MPKSAWPTWAAAEYDKIDNYLKRIQAAADQIMRNGVSGDMNTQEASQLLDQLQATARLLELTCYRVNRERAGGDRWPRWAIQVLDKGPILSSFIADACLIGRDGIKQANFDQLAEAVRQILEKLAGYARNFYGGIKPESEGVDTIYHEETQ